MEIRRIRYFVAVAEELSFTRAAERLHIAQPPLSTQIRALEDELGARLFERDRRRVFLTQAGRHLLARARTILASVGLGLMESFIGGFFEIVWQDASVFVAMILVLLLRPEGLLDAATVRVG